MRYLSVKNDYAFWDKILEDNKDKEWIASEKIDGKNVGISVVSGKIVSIQGRRTDLINYTKNGVKHHKNIKTFKGLINHVEKESFKEDIDLARLGRESNNYTVFGELYVDENQEYNITFFAVVFKDNYPMYDYVPITNKNHRNGAKLITSGNIYDILDKSYDELEPSHLGKDKIFEGVVATLKDGFTWSVKEEKELDLIGKDYPFPILKIKTEAYKEYRKDEGRPKSKKADRELTPKEEEVMAMITPGRIHNVLGYLSIETPDKSDTYQVVNATYEDIKKEFVYDKFEDKSEINQFASASKKSRIHFMKC